MQKPTDYAVMAIYSTLLANPSSLRQTMKALQRLKMTALANIIQQKLISQSGGNMGH
jgi:hypothetical protein